MIDQVESEYVKVDRVDRVESNLFERSNRNQKCKVFCFPSWIVVLVDEPFRFDFSICLEHADRFHCWPPRRCDPFERDEPATGHRPECHDEQIALSNRMKSKSRASPTLLERRSRTANDGIGVTSNQAEHLFNLRIHE